MGLFSLWKSSPDNSEDANPGDWRDRCVERGLSESDAKSKQSSENMASDYSVYSVRPDLPKR